jgi:hypothetical protein
MNHLRYFIVLALLVTSCSMFSEDASFTKKMNSPAFVSELYGCTTQVLAVSHDEASYIEWMGFIQSNDYSYYKILKVVSGSKTIVSDGKDDYTANSNSIIEDFSVSETSSTENEYTDGSISVAGSVDLQVTVEYCPLIAPEDEEDTHEANLVINYSEPDSGSVRIALNGYVQGTKDEKCTQNVSTMEAIEYEVKGGAFDLYFCSKQVALFDQNNTPESSSDPDYHGDSTNLGSIELSDPIITFYQVDDETVCLLSEPEPSIPDFILPIPKGIAPIDTMDISMEAGSYAECSLDGDGNIYCDENILIDALVSMSGFSISNQTFTASDLETSDCPDFGEISGSGVFGDSELTLILQGTVLSDQNSEEYEIVDGLVVSVIELEK